MQATQITNLTASTIELLLTNDVPFKVNRAKFEDYITEGKGYYEYTLDHYEPISGHRETTHIVSLSEYWAAIGQAQIDHINDYMQQEPSILVELAMLDILEYVKMDMQETESSLLLLKSKISYYGHCYFNAAVAYKPEPATNMQQLAANLLGFGTDLNNSK